MKTLFAFVLAFSSVNAFAAPKIARIAHIKTDAAVFGAGRFTDGYLRVDGATRNATLSLQPEFRCRGGQYCAQVMPMRIVISLPLVSVKTNECDVVTYLAKEDARDIDGGLRYLKIVDHSRDRCQSAREDASVIATYETDSFSRRGHARTRSKFYATPFLSARSAGL